MKAKLLKMYRKQFYDNLDFVGSWSGRWQTTVNGCTYRSEVVSGFNYVIFDTGTFLQDTLIDVVRKKNKL